MCSYSIINPIPFYSHHITWTSKTQVGLMVTCECCHWISLQCNNTTGRHFWANHLMMWLVTAAINTTGTCLWQNDWSFSENNLMTAVASWLDGNLQLPPLMHQAHLPLLPSNYFLRVMCWHFAVTSYTVQPWSHPPSTQLATATIKSFSQKHLTVVLMVAVTSHIIKWFAQEHLPVVLLGCREI